MRFSLIIAFPFFLAACSGGGSGTVGTANEPLNRAPVAVGDTVETPAGSSKLIDVLANDTDPDGDALTLTIIQQPANGTAYVDDGVTTASDDDTIVYTPGAAFSGQDEIVYTISDGSTGRASGSVLITVLPPANPVTTARADTALTMPNTSLNVYVLANDWSDGSSPLGIGGMTAPVAGTVVINDNGTPEKADDFLSYTPSPGFVGTDSFVYELTSGQRAPVQVEVNPDPSTPIGAVISGSVIKGPVRNALVRFYSIDNDGNRLGSAVAQTVTDENGRFSAMLPLPRTDLLAVSSGGDFVDETDSQSDPAQRRIIVFAADDELESLSPANTDYLAINVYSNSILRHTIRTAAPGQFATRYSQLRNEFSTALGFDPITTAPANPDAPDPTESVIERQYAMALGGIATALSKVAVRLHQNEMSYGLVSGVIDDLGRCLLDGGNESGPVTVLLDGLPVALPGDVNLNNEILRFRNNKISVYVSTPLLQFDLQGCAGAPPPPPPPLGGSSPTALDIDIANVDENSPVGTLVGRFSTTDVDPGDSHVYTLVPGIGDSGNVSFVVSGNQLLTNAVFDFEAQSSYSIRVRTDDSTSAPFERSFTITIGNLNETPATLALDNSTIDENRPAGALVGKLSTVDDTGDSHTYTLAVGGGDIDNGNFTIVGDQLLSSGVFDFESKASYSIRVRTDDSVTTPFERNFTITINDVNEAPTALNLDSVTIDENRPAATSVGTLTTTDQDTGDSHSYTLAAGGGDIDNGSFTIVGDQLLSSGVFDFESKSSYSIRVRTDDSVTTPFERTFTIIVNDVNDAPTALSLDSVTIDENQPASSLVGTFTTTDQDTGDSHTYTLAIGGGDIDNGSFTIVGDQLRSSGPYDFESKASYSIRVRTDDSVTTPFERNFTITINDVNDAPTALSLDSVTIDENQPASSLVGTFTTTDQDTGDSHTYTLAIGGGDIDNGSFTIVGDQLLSSGVFDFESKASYSIRVRTDDSVTTPFERTFTITVNDVNDAPTALSLDSVTIDENQPASSLVGTFTTTDQDTGDSHTYTLAIGGGDIDNGSFTIVGDQLRSSGPYDFESKASYSIRVRTDDSVTTPFERNFTITINDVNDAPTALSLDSVTIDENQPASSLVGTFTTTDQDTGDSHTYTLAIGGGDIDNGSFTIVGDQLFSNGPFDFENKDSYSIRVRTDDSVTTPFERVFTLSINDVNEAPTPGDDYALTPVNTALAIAVLGNDTDPESDTLSLISVTSPTGASGTATVNDNGTPAIFGDDFIDYAPQAGYSGSDSFSYTVSDGALTTDATITVTVSDYGYVAVISPTDGAKLVPLAQDVQIVFTQAMNAATLDTTTLFLSTSITGVPQIAATVTYNPGTLTATIDPLADLVPNTSYYVHVSSLIENLAGQPQGFSVRSVFSVITDPTDMDSDGISDADESSSGICLDPANPDSDFDGVGDGAEVLAGGDPCSDQGQSIWYVDDDGPAGGWPTAVTGFGGYTSGTPGNPNYVLVAQGTYLDQIDYAANCDNLVFAGSQDPANAGAIIRNTDGSPTTVVDMGLSLNSEFADCSEVTIRDIQLSNGVGNGGAKGGGLRVSGTTTATIDSVWLTDNITGDQGGGLGVSNSSIATVRNSRIGNNLVTGGKGGGGIWVGANATLNLADSLIIDNQAIASGGGGLYFDPASTGTITNTYLVGNSTSGNGAGIFVLNGAGATVEISESVITGNLASVNGGGIYVKDSGASSFVAQHNRIVSNRAALGGGIMLDDTGSIATIQNNLILGNYGPNGGGAIFLDTTAPELRNNTIIYNITDQPSGAAVAEVGGNPIIRDSIIWKNRAGARPLSAPVTALDNYTPAITQSDFNLLDVDKIGASDLDFVNDGVTPGFDSGFYLNQLTSAAVNTGSDTAAFLGLDSRFTAAGGPTDNGVVDRGFHHPNFANYPADGYIETASPTDNAIVVTNTDFGGNAVVVLIRPLVSGATLGPGHHLVATLEGSNTGLAQLRDVAGVDPLSDGESVILADLGDGQYRAYIEAQGSIAVPSTIPLRILVDEQILPIVFNIDRVP